MAAKSPRRKPALTTTFEDSGMSNSRKLNSSISDGSESQRSRTPNCSCQLENTYRLQPEGQGRFQRETVRTLMLQTLEGKLKDVEYDSSTCGDLSTTLTNEIMFQIKQCHWERYKLVVQLFVGQDEKQGIQVASRCVWNADVDTSACVTYKNSSLFAVASCYAVYFE
ncbi:dynein light chain Tctex-type 5-like [Gigantopelta aegis]|uniref:dynein light chain Tctex-type 5-like n=1 Tax=Gigantopelta aegis TaxID=1735272 RepID=UPI001B88D1EB|nr:dynein light chain Tctex-type 5-like [Gigantopelta aegis]